MKSSENLLMVADSDHDANMLYATGMFVPDPFIYLRLRGRATILMSDLEIDRARKQAPHCRVVSLSAYQKKLRQTGVKLPKLAHVIHAFLRERGVRRVTGPPNFSLSLADELKQLGISVKAKPSGFFPDREQKTPAEVKKISAALVMAEVGMAEAMQVLRASKVGRDGRLLYHNVPLTSEKLRSVIDTAILCASGLAAHTIVAGGKQGCDPHECGYGPLRANEPIIIDIFPRSQKTGYFGDITRTVVRGHASEGVRRLYDTVLSGQKLAFQKVRAGVTTVDVHQAVQKFFVQQGYKTGRRKGRMEGFFHGTGHGLGLEIHEAPRMGANSPGALKPGHVVTVEPGLYYPELGGVRLEDVALVTNNGARNLTRFEKVLEIDTQERGIDPALQSATSLYAPRKTFQQQICLQAELQTVTFTSFIRAKMRKSKAVKPRRRAKRAPAALRHPAKTSPKRNAARRRFLGFVPRRIIPDPTTPAAPTATVPAVAAVEPPPTERERGSYDGDTAIKLYLCEVGQVKLLTPREEIVLAARIKKGDKKAREHMIKANLRLVVKIARDYEGIGLPLLDLISEGNIGLMKAVERFDPAKGGKLSTYGSWWIKQSIKRALANQSKTIRLPVHLVDKISKMRRIGMRLQEQLGREPTDDEVAFEMGIPTSRVTQMRLAAIRPASLDAAIGDEDSNTFAEVVQDESAETPYEQLEEKTVTGMLQEMVTTLDSREATILRARFGLDGGPEKTLEEVGKTFGVTRERVRQIQNIALRKLRKMIEKLEATKK